MLASQLLPRHDHVVPQSDAIVLGPTTQYIELKILRRASERLIAAIAVASPHSIDARRVDIGRVHTDLRLSTLGLRDIDHLQLLLQETVGHRDIVAVVQGLPFVLTIEPIGPVTAFRYVSNFSLDSGRSIFRIDSKI